MNRIYVFAKETGLLANLLTSLFMMFVGVLLPYLKHYISLLQQRIIVSISISTVFMIVLMVVALLYFVVKLFTNPAVQYARLQGYYRKQLDYTAFPYERDSENRLITRYVLISDFYILRPSISYIGPFLYMTSKTGRGSNSDGEVRIHQTKVTVNDVEDDRACEITPGLNGNKWLRIRCPVSVGVGTKIRLVITYTVRGEHASCSEELVRYLQKPDLPNLVRIDLQRSMNAEVVNEAPSFAAKYIMRVIFPENYPWKLPQDRDTVVRFSFGQSLLDARRTLRLRKMVITPQSITICYIHQKLPTSYMNYILWILPTHDELIKSGFMASDLNSESKDLT